MQKLLVVLFSLTLAVSVNWAVGQEPKPEGPAIQPLVEKLGDKEDKVRFDAVVEMSKLGEKAQPAVGELTKLLADPNPNIRLAAAHALGTIGPAAKDAVPALLEALSDTAMTNSGFPVWVPASVALGKIGPETVPPLVEMLKSSDKQKQQAAANALAQIGPAAKEAVGPLVAILQQNDPETRTAMMIGLIGIGPEAKEAVPALITMLDSDDFHTQYWAQRTLAAIGPEAKPAVPKLIELLSTGAVSVRRHSAIALGDIGPGIGQEGLDALIQGLGDWQEPVREDAVVALGKLGDFAQPAVPTLRKILDNRRIAARVATARALWGLTHDADATVPVLIEALEDPNAAIPAAEFLGEIGPAAEKAVPALSVAFVKGEPELREAAMKAVEKITPKEPKKEKNP
jgi:HEAT repeat protein